MSENDKNRDHDRGALAEALSSKSVTSLSADQHRSWLATKWKGPREEAFLLILGVFVIVVVFLMYLFLDILLNQGWKISANLLITLT